MRKNIIWASLTVFTSLLQTTWLDGIQIQGVTPSLTLLLVIYFALADGEERAMYTGVLAGLFQDVASESVLGHHVLCYVIVGYLVGRVSVRLITQNPAVKVGLVCLASLISGLLFTIVLAVQDPQWSLIATIRSNVIPSTLYTALATPLAFFLIDRLFGRALENQ